MEKFVVKKVENCFKNAQTYEYALSFETTDERIKALTKEGMLTIKTNFRRPFFSISYTNGSNAKGVIGDYRIKASFPEDHLEESKEIFEKILTHLNKETKDET